MKYLKSARLKLPAWLGDSLCRLTISLDYHHLNWMVGLGYLKDDIFKPSNHYLCFRLLCFGIGFSYLEKAVPEPEEPCCNVCSGQHKDADCLK